MKKDKRIGLVGAFSGAVGGALGSVSGSNNWIVVFIISGIFSLIIFWFLKGLIK